MVWIMFALVDVICTFVINDRFIYISFFFHINKSTTLIKNTNLIFLSKSTDYFLLLTYLLTAHSLSAHIYLLF